jgi:hypothetical protein
MPQVGFEIWPDNQGIKNHALGSPDIVGDMDQFMLLERI